MSVIAAPGIFPDVTPDEYFAEPCPAPALTNSGIGMLLSSCPAKFAHHHPAIGGGQGRAATVAQTRGSLVHRFALGKGGEFVVSPFDDYRTKEARAWKAEQEAAGITPIKQADHDEAQDMAAIIRDRVDEAVDGEPYQTEVVIAWQRRGLWCRAMLDVWCPSRLLALDVKTCRSADDLAVQKAFANGYGRQDAWYRDGLARVTGEHGRVRFGFLFVESEPPHLSRAAFATEGMRQGCLAECDRAFTEFEECMTAGQWPGYAPLTVEPTSWQVREWIDAEIEEAA